MSPRKLVIEIEDFSVPAAPRFMASLPELPKKLPPQVRAHFHTFHRIPSAYGDTPGEAIEKLFSSTSHDTLDAYFEATEHL